MTTVEAPGKLNLSLLVEPPAPNGYHPLDSLVQTIEWCDTLEVEAVDDDADQVTVDGADIDPDVNLVLKALREVRKHIRVAPQAIRLSKVLPIAAGLGGGSSDAAATLLVTGEGLEREVLVGIAGEVGADVSLFLTGGTLRMGGFGEQVESLRSLGGFALAVAVPEFGLVSAEVYRRWDELGGPVGEELPQASAPPQLRGQMPLRNDLLPAALSIEPGLGEYMAELRSVWGTAVAMTGSGSACFGYFPTLDEAADAALAVEGISLVARGVDLRSRGVAIVAADDEE
jgi:4-diphosphocytidyl-2-C-methyl-D-erythritol kinase